MNGEFAFLFEFEWDLFECEWGLFESGTLVVLVGLCLSNRRR